jgi:ketosteroid isomerase-like protein
MSQENVELVRKLLDVYNERSFKENRELIDPDMVWDMTRLELPDASSYTGPLEFSDFVETWEQGFASEHMEAKEIVDAGNRVVVMIHHRGHGKLSGIDVEQHFAMVWTLRDGRAVRMEMFRTREEALEAAGLSEQDAHADSP